MDKKQLYTLLYASSASKELDDSELTALLNEIREKNEKMGVTGILLYGNKSFLQVLEGEKKQLQQLFKRIEKDPRHRTIVRLHEQELEERIFGEWSMAFKRIVPEQSDKIPGFSSFMEDAGNSEVMKQNAKQIHSFMKTFRWMHKS